MDSFYSSSSSSEDEQQPARRGPGRTAVRFDAQGIHDRERKKKNRLTSPSKRNRPGRQKSEKRKFVRRSELAWEKALAEELSGSRMDDQEAQAKLIAASQIRVVKKKFRGAPLFANMQTAAEVEEKAKVHENARKYYRSLSRSNKKNYTDAMTSDVSTSTSASLLGVTERSIRRFKQVVKLSRADRKSKFREEFESEDDVDSALAYEKETVADLEAKMYVKFFEDNTGVISGSERETRVLDIPKFELMCRLFGAFPTLLRELNAEHRGLLPSLPPKSRLRVAMEAALASEQTPGFSKGAERERRTDMARQKYRAKLLAKRQRSNKSILPAKVNKTVVAEKKLSAAEQAQENLIQPIRYHKFLDLIKAAKIRWTKKSKPYNCPLHEKYPKQQADANTFANEEAAVMQKLNELMQKLNALPLTTEQKQEVGRLNDRLKVLRAKLRFLRSAIAHYKQHEEQFERCRKELEDLERELPVGEAVLYRDFVNQYNSGGKKIGNLQLVILFRTEEKMPLVQIKVYNFSGGDGGVQCDPYFVQDVMDFHMKPVEQGGSGVLGNFSKIHISGDHGSHFSSTKTIFNESRMFERYGIKVRIISLCSYHCYNRCDAAGVIGKNLAAKAAKEGKELRTSGDYAQGTMQSGSPETLAYDFEQINRSEEVWPEKIVSKKEAIGETLRNMCEIEYEVLVMDEQAQILKPTYITGVAKCRAVPNRGDWKVFDLRESMQSSFCQKCSNRHVRPVYHTGGTNACPATSTAQDAQVSAAIKINPAATPQDDQDRHRMLNGRQVDKKTATVASSKEFPCKFCEKRRYAWGYLANVHMDKEHHELIRPGTSLYPDDQKAQKEAVKAARAARALSQGLQTAINPSETTVVALEGALAPALAPALPAPVPAPDPAPVPAPVISPVPAEHLAPDLPAPVPAPVPEPVISPVPGEALAPDLAPNGWVCPCKKASGNLKRSAMKLTGNQRKRGTAFWLCDTVADQCTEGKATEVTVLPVRLERVEIKSAVRGGWVTFGGHEGAPAMPPIDPDTVVEDLNEHEVIIYKSEKAFHVARVIGAYMTTTPPTAEVHRFGSYAAGGVLKGALKPAYIDQKDGLFVFTLKPGSEYYPDIQDVTGEMILARGVELDTYGKVPRDVADKIGSGETATQGRSSASSAFWYEEYRLYRSLQDASEALQDTRIEPPGEQAHVVITVPRTSSLASPGVAPEPFNEYEHKRGIKIAANQAQLKALGILELRQFLDENTGAVPERKGRGGKRGSTQDCSSATDEEG